MEYKSKKNCKKRLAITNTEDDKNYYQQKCQSLDNQIDKLVYELYGLTEVEIKVEGYPTTFANQQT